ncbi:YIP1 family protein [Emticicia soli]|uniref:YIP1 family protein n=1 Tax=Emticicia soli TaxID=2027878 RepID=A0ABW5J4V5_9BACT
MEVNNNKYSVSELIQYLFINPKAAFQDIILWNRAEVVHITFFLVSIEKAFERAELNSFGDRETLQSIIISAILIGGISGYVFMHLYSFAIDFSGKWIDGKARKKEIRNVVAWASIPSIFLIIVFLLRIIAFSDNVFRSESTYEDNEFSEYLGYFFAIIQIVLSFISLRLLIIGISIAQQFSVGKAILNIVLAILLLVIPLVLLVMGFYLLKGNTA